LSWAGFEPGPSAPQKWWVVSGYYFYGVFTSIHPHSTLPPSANVPTTWPGQTHKAPGSLFQRILAWPWGFSLWGCSIFDQARFMRHPGLFFSESWPGQLAVQAIDRVIESRRGHHCRSCITHQWNTTSIHKWKFLSWVGFKPGPSATQNCALITRSAGRLLASIPFMGYLPLYILYNMIFKLSTGFYYFKGTVS
jgi:hypothetical protein